MSHYETLGIDRTASQEEIKRAFRQKSSEFHPDRNSGSKDDTDKMAQVNIAYDVLSDPDRRRRYDETGIDGMSNAELAKRAMSVLIGMIGDAIENCADHEDYIDLIKQTAAGNANARVSEREVLIKRKAKWSRARERIKSKSGDEHLNALFEAKLKGFDRAIGVANANIELFNCVGKMADDYECTAASFSMGEYQMVLPGGMRCLFLA